MCSEYSSTRVMFVPVILEHFVSYAVKYLFFFFFAVKYFVVILVCYSKVRIGIFTQIKIMFGTFI